jgi:hypothetical protein
MLKNQHNDGGALPVLVRFSDLKAPASLKIGHI